MIRLASRAYSTLKTIHDFRSNPLANLSSLEAGMTPRVDSTDSCLHEIIIRRILASYQKVKAKQVNMPSTYQPSGQWKTCLDLTRTGYIEALDKGDVSSLSNSLKNLFRTNDFSMARLSILRQMKFVNRVLYDLAMWRRLVGADISSLSSPSVGNPGGYVVDDTLITVHSLRHHYYASHVENLLAEVEHPVVAEIGATFGGFAYYLLSFKKPHRYLDFDLPEILVQAQYYLMSAFPNKKVLLFGETEEEDITSHTIEQYDLILMPNFQLPKLASDSVDLFINTASLSEMDYNIIEEYIRQIARTCRLFFLHDNSDEETFLTENAKEVPSSKFPIPNHIFKRIYKHRSPWARSSRYYEHLYQRLGSRTL